jgi:Mg-chelatase subunit ChlD
MALEIGKGAQVIFLVDRSGSMDTPDCDGGETRYRHAKEKIKAFVTAASKYDPDGVSVHLFNNSVDLHQDVATADAVDALVKEKKPGGGTATEKALKAAWNEHATKGNQSTFVFVFTDGEPNEQQAVIDTLVQITKKMKSAEEFRISFLTVGKRTPDLQAFLSKLDSELSPAGAVFDIVSVDELDNVDFQQAADNLIGSSTTNAEAAAGQTTGKVTTQI